MKKKIQFKELPHKITKTQAKKKINLLNRAMKLNKNVN
jgi:hypothetical protein